MTNGPSSDKAGVEQRMPVEFTASASEYFRIWIVNLALTVVTLGIYSAWAKVRKKRYFYGHTLIDGEGFEYRGNPVAILKGRIVAVALLGLYSLASYLPDAARVASLVAVAVVLPWLVVRSFAFNARNSAYRNVQFRFDGSYRDAATAIVGYGVLMLATAGILYPLWKAKTTRFAWSHHAWGATRFAIRELTAPLYLVYLKAVGLLLALLVAALAAAATLAFALLRQWPVLGVATGVVVGAVMIYAVYLPVFAFVRARTANLVMNRASVGPLRFECRQRARDVAALYLGNAIVIALTLGLAVPWAVIRAMRYRASHLTLVSSESLDDFAAAESAQVGATGSEVVELLDLDFGL